MPSTRPIAPCAISSRIAGTACEPSDWKPIWQTTPAAATPSAIRRNSAYEGAGGFSSRTCTPLAAAVSARSVWVGIGVQITAIAAPVESSRAPKSADCSGSSPGAVKPSSSASVSGASSQIPARRTRPLSWRRRMFARCQWP